MRIKTRLDQIRRDFWAIYECEHCGFEYKGSGYDDANFHHNVIPHMECSKCGRSADGRATSGPTVPEGVVL